MMAVTGPEPASMHTRDGVRLDADIYRPATEGPHPVLLMRQPYGRRIASTVVYAHPAWYAAQGYIVAIQDVRGTGTSEGRFRLFADEARDGADAVAWAAALPGSSGRVGMYGFSYQGNTQLLALAGCLDAGTEHLLGALCPVMAGWDMFDDWAYEGGAFCFAAGLGWGVQMAADQARRAGDAEGFRALLEAARALPLTADVPCRPPVIEAQRARGHYHDWLENDAPGAYWDGIAPRAALAGRTGAVPMLHVGGWFDPMLMGTLAGHAALSAGAARQALVVGPWTHLPWGRRVGAVDFGADAVGAIDTMQRDWFDHWLKGAANDVPAWPAVRLFDLLDRRWRGFDAMPAPAPRALHTSSDGLAAVTASGRLDAAPGSGIDWLVHDPWRPVPSLGGHAGSPPGMQDRAALDDRADVLTYTTPPLEAPLALAGPVGAVLDITADAPSFDVSAALSAVAPDGRAWTLTHGYRRVDRAADAAPVAVAMRALCATVPAGHALRLSLAGASFPAFAVNPGTGASPGAARLMESRVITLRLAHGRSRLDLPVT